MSIGPSKTAGAQRPSRRKAATTVCVSQWPNGAWSREARAAGASAVAPQQISRDAAFIEEHVLAHVAQRLPRPPLPAGGGDIRPALLVGVYRFF